MKKLFLSDISSGAEFESSFMILKKLFNDGKNTVAFIGDKTGDIKANIRDPENIFKVGDVIEVKSNRTIVIDAFEVRKLEQFDLDDYLPTVKRPVQDIMDEIEQMTKEELKSPECLALNDYFFNNEEFLEKFKKGIGGLSQHHNYRGGLPEHTLNVMYISKVLAYRYDSLHKDIAILAAKLHDIGKIEEYFVDGPFSVTMRGDMEGHIVMGVEMLDEAFMAGGKVYSEDFKQRMKGCITQHHGKLEYGSPKVPNTEEAYIVHYADFVDATFNKIGQIRETTEPNTWAEYDRRIGVRLYI